MVKKRQDYNQVVNILINPKTNEGVTFTHTYGEKGNWENITCYRGKVEGDDFIITETIYFPPSSPALKAWGDEVNSLFMERRKQKDNNESDVFAKKLHVPTLKIIENNA
jgi:hypothetical protein